MGSVREVGGARNTQVLLQLLELKPGSPGIPRMEKGKRAFKHAYRGIVGLAKLGVSRGDPMMENCGLLVPKPWGS